MNYSKQKGITYMKKRIKLKKRTSRRMFTKNALKTEVRNILSHPMRGGIRL